jgi:hypothetical protein
LVAALEFLFAEMVKATITAQDIIDGQPHESFTHVELMSLVENLEEVADEWERQGRAAKD